MQVLYDYVHTVAIYGCDFTSQFTTQSSVSKLQCVDGHWLVSSYNVESYVVFLVFSVMCRWRELGSLESLELVLQDL